MNDLLIALMTLNLYFVDVDDKLFVFILQFFTYNNKKHQFLKFTFEVGTIDGFHRHYSYQKNNILLSSYIFQLN